MKVSQFIVSHLGQSQGTALLPRMEYSAEFIFTQDVCIQTLQPSQHSALQDHETLRSHRAHGYAFGPGFVSMSPANRRHRVAANGGVLSTELRRCFSGRRRKEKVQFSWFKFWNGRKLILLKISKCNTVCNV